MLLLASTLFFFFFYIYLYKFGRVFIPSRHGGGLRTYVLADIYNAFQPLQLPRGVGTLLLDKMIGRISTLLTVHIKAGDVHSAFVYYTGLGGASKHPWHTGAK